MLQQYQLAFKLVKWDTSVVFNAKHCRNNVWKDKYKPPVQHEKQNKTIGKSEIQKGKNTKFVERDNKDSHV